jgi:hypothetical protein
MFKRTKPLWKVGDWCFCEFKLSQIEKMDKARVTAITTGYIAQSARDLTSRCFPVTVEVKRLSERWESANELSHKCPSLNHPDIHEYLVRKWAEACERATTGDIGLGLGACYAGLDDFERFLRNAVREQSEIFYDGVRLFGRVDFPEGF